MLMLRFRYVPLFQASQVLRIAVGREMNEVTADLTKVKLVNREHGGGTRPSTTSRV